MQRKRLVTLTALALIVGATLWAPSFASAQDPLLDPVTDVTDPVVGELTDPAEGSTDPGTDPSTDPAEGGSEGGLGDVITDPVDELIDEPVEEVVNPVAEVIEDTGGSWGETIEDLTDPVKDTLDPVTNVVKETVPGMVGGLPGKILGDAKKEVEKVLPPRPQHPAGNRTTGDGGQQQGTPAHSQTVPAAAALAERVAREVGAVAQSSGESFRVAPVESVPSSAPAVQQSVVQQITEAAAQAAQKLAFPLALTLLVIAFLILQGRLDNKEAKLTLAPVEADQDTLSFS